jgi:hypothetical protein
MSPSSWENGPETLEGMKAMTMLGEDRGLTEKTFSHGTTPPIATPVLSPLTLSERVSSSMSTPMMSRRPTGKSPSLLARLAYQKPSGPMFYVDRRSTWTMNMSAAPDELVPDPGTSNSKQALAKISRTVKTVGDWTIAWNTASKAVVFAFPHRREELDEYAEWQGHFATHQTRLECQVIELDKAIQRHVGERNDIELTEFGKFAKFEKAYLQSSGVFFTDRPAGRPRGEPVIKSSEVC